jgi:Yip1-like protein
MTLIDRVKNICLTPQTEWPVIAEETTPTGTLVTGYVMPLVAIGAVAGFIGGSIVGHSLPFIGTYRVPLVTGLMTAVLVFVFGIVGVLIVGAIINALAPTFGGQQNSAQAFKVAAYSFTPGWVAGVLQIVPMLGVLGLLAALYGLYLLYLGLPKLMKCPPDKAVGYTAVVVVAAIVVTLVFGGIVAAIGGAGMIATGALSGAATTGRSSEVQFAKDSPLGKLQDLGKKLEESNKKMEAAQKSGDQQAAAAAAVEGLGTLLGGGKRVDPVAIDVLKPFVPETFAGLAKTSSRADKSGIAGFMVSKAEATYGSGDKEVSLDVSDTGGVSGLVSLASWAALQGESDDSNASERTQKVNGRLVHERRSKTGGANEFGLILGDRFVVNARGRGVSVDELKAAVSALDLGKLEAMKDAGVQK